MDDLVEQDCEIENGQPLHERQWDPNQWIVEPDEAPRGDTEYRKLPGCDQEMPERGLLVKFAHLVARDGFAQLSPERNRVLRVVMGLHRTQAHSSRGVCEKGSTRFYRVLLGSAGFVHARTN